MARVVTTQPTKDLTPEKLVSYMVGREMKERFPKGNRQPGEVIFEVEDLHAADPNKEDREVLKGVTFDLRKGEILGIAGLMGSGRTELVMTIFGEYAKITQGTIKLEGKNSRSTTATMPCRRASAWCRKIASGMGLVLIQTILKNISLPNLDQFSSFMRIDQNAEVVESLRIASQEPGD